MSKLHEYITYLRYLWRIRTDKELRSFRKELKILDSEATVKKIIEEKLSVCRFGDGEFLLIAGGKSAFQSANNGLSIRLRDILLNPKRSVLTCIPFFYKNHKDYVFRTRLYATGYLCSNAKTRVIPFCDVNYEYGDSLFTRFYMMKKNKKMVCSFVPLLKNIWDKKDVLLVEGAYTRLGVGNDLFDNATSIKRLICPSKNAYDLYDEILNQSKMFGKKSLILIALGMTATVLAYDLANLGYWAIDIGHVDIEYMWLQMGAKKKCHVPGKILEEIPGEDDFDLPEKDLALYESQIIGRIE